MSLRSSRDQLTRAMEELFLHWERTRQSWRDSRAREFEEKVLGPLRPEVLHAARAMERMAANLSRARQECGRLEGS